MASLQILVFDVGETRCALRREGVQEILPLPRLWRPPSLPRPVAGFFNFGGTAVAAVRLDILFGMRETPTDAHDLYRHLILIRESKSKHPMALLVDRVVDVTSVTEQQLSPVRETSSLNGCVEAELDLSGRLVHLLSLDKILFAEEQEAIAVLGRNAQDRLSEWAALT